MGASIFANIFQHENAGNILSHFNSDLCLILTPNRFDFANGTYLLHVLYQFLVYL